MNKFLGTFLTFFLFANTLFSQMLMQSVRGTITDSDSKIPIVGAIIKIQDVNTLIVTESDNNGDFKLDNVPVGRISLHVSYAGYESKIIPDIEVNSGKQKIVNIGMQESIITLNEVVVKSTNKEKGEPVNDMSLISTRSISAEETRRYAGGFNDPARILTNFAGVTNTQNGENDIIVRGNAPKYVQWRLEGVEISNPTHFADQNSAKGGISALNNSLLATSDFSTAAFSPEYGDVLSGVFDVKLRSGNNQKRETSIGAGILGTDLTLEGPIKKGYGGSYLFNYRYSTISLISDLGLVNIDGALNFQDAAFKIVLPSKKIGSFTFFGLGGLSSFKLKDVKANMISTPSNGTNPSEISEDYDKGNFLSNYGLNHVFNINHKSYFKTTLSYSDNGLSEDIYKIKTIKLSNNQDSIGNKQLDYRNRLKKSTYRIALTFNKKIDSKHTMQIGTKYALFGYDYNLSQLIDSNQTRQTAVALNENVSTLRNFISCKRRINERLTLVTGFHNMNVLYNNKSTLEPRVAFNYKLNSTNSINAGYGKHSTMESIHNYFAKVKQTDGIEIEPNKDLDLLKAHHYVLGYEKRFKDKIRLKAEAYYQYLYNLPVENLSTSHYSTINEGNDFKYVALVNKGTGKNYGLELTVERFFNNNYYYLINASVFNSKYQSLEGIERNTLYNGNYLVNILAGKEYENLGRKKNQTLNLNMKAFFGGGQKYIPLLRDDNGNVAVDPATNRFWDYNKAYNNSLENIYQITISASYKWNKRRATHELFINLDNITGTKGKLSEYYDDKKEGKIGYVTQFGFFPNLMYKVYF